MSEPHGSAILTDVERKHTVGSVSLGGLELERRFLQTQDVGEDVLVQACDQLQLRRRQREARALQLDGDGHLARPRVHREVGDLEEGHIHSHNHCFTSSMPHTKLSFTKDKRLGP